MSSKLQRTIKIEEGIIAKVEALAEEEERTFSDMVRTLIREALKARGN